MLAVLIFSLVGMIAGGSSSFLVTILIPFILQIPQLSNLHKNISEFSSFMYGISLLIIFSSFRMIYRKLYKSKRPLRIGFIGAFMIAIFVSMVSTYAMTKAEFFIANKEFIEKGKVKTYKDGVLIIEKYVYDHTPTVMPVVKQVTTNYEIPAYLETLIRELEFSVRHHPIFMLVFLVSCFLSIWTTIPSGLRKVVSIAGEVET